MDERVRLSDLNGQRLMITDARKLPAVFAQEILHEPDQRRAVQLRVHCLALR